MLGAALAFGLAAPAAAQTAVAHVTIDTSKTGAEIDRHIYGQFAEHLGRGIYEGIWVGENSKIPNIHGYRKDVVEALQQDPCAGGALAGRLLRRPLQLARRHRPARQASGAHQCPLGRRDRGQQFRHP